MLLTLNVTKIAWVPLPHDRWKMSGKKVMFVSTLVLILVASIVCFKFDWAGIRGTPVADFANTSGAPAAQFFIAPCSTSITGGKASLVIGSLQGNAETYVGNYDLKVFPYFFMNETGSLLMPLP